jgi:hypothetical protein
MKISLWVFKIQGFESGIQVSIHGVMGHSLIPSGRGCEITKHLKLI